MICYRDRTYCSAACTNTACSRLVTQEVETAAANFGLPLGLSDYSARCPDYQPEAPDRG